MEKLILVVILSALIALLGRNRKIGYGWSLAICLLASPIVGLIFILFSKKKSDKSVEFIEVDSKK